jgi:hypothetical protein
MTNKNWTKVGERDKSSVLRQILVGNIFHLLTFPTKWHTQVSNILVS